MEARQVFLRRTFRDNRTGKVHNIHECLTVAGSYRELGTHRTLLKVNYTDGTSGIVLPEDIELQGEEEK